MADAAMPTKGYADSDPNPRTGGCLLLVLPDAPLGLPRLETVVVKPNRPPVLGANQAHPLVDPDRKAAAIAGLPEAGTVPQLKGVMTWQIPFGNPVSNKQPHAVGCHLMAALHIAANEVDSGNRKHIFEGQVSRPIRSLVAFPSDT